MKSFIRNILQSVGLHEWARPIVWSMRARGWLPWPTPLVPAEQFTISCDHAISSIREAGVDFGHCLEFGVSRGTSLACMYHALRNAGLPNVELIGFDSFEGMPSEADSQGWTAGAYASTTGATRRYLVKAGVELGDVRLVKGWFSDTLSSETAAMLNIDKASLIMIDCDIYTSTRQALWFCEPLIKDTSVIIFDDWGWRSDKGEVGQREAFAEFLEAFPYFTTDSLPAYIPQARIFLVTRQSIE